MDRSRSPCCAARLGPATRSRLVLRRPMLWWQPCRSRVKLAFPPQLRMRASVLRVSGPHPSMRRRLLPSLLLLLALALPSGAAAATQRWAAPSGGSDDSLTPKQTLRKAEAVAAGRTAGGRELTPLLKELTTKLPALAGADRTRARRLLARPTPGETAANESGYTTAEQPPVCGVHFCVPFVATTVDAAPASYVQTMLGVFEEVYN